MSDDARLLAAQLKAVFHAMADGVAIADAQGNFLLVNSAEARINGFEEAEYMLRNVAYYRDFYELWDERGRAIAYGDWPMARVIRGESFSNWVLRTRRNDINREWIKSYSGEPIRGATGEVTLAVVITRDLTQQRHAETALRATEQRYAAVYEHAPFGIALSRPEGEVEAVNEMFLRLFERTRDELVGFTGLTAGLIDAQSRAQLLARLAQTGEVRDFETTRALKAGGLRTLSLNINRLELEGEQRLMTTVRDVSAQKLADQKLAAERERLAVTLESIGDAVVACDASQHITLFNRLAAQFTGWAPAEALGRSVSELVACLETGTGETTVNVVGDVLSDGVVRRADNLTLRANHQRERPIDLTVAAIRDDEGAISGAVVVLRDQTNERNALRALRASEARYRSIFEQSALGVMVIEANTGRVLECNRRMSEMLGYSQAELQQRRWQDFTHPDDVSTNERGLAAMEQARELYRCEKRYLRKDGGVIWVNLTVNPATTQGVGVNTNIAVIEDVTEHRRITEQLQQAQKLESVGRLAGGVAHDFNNLLTVILSCAQFLERDLARGKPPNPEDLDEIRIAGERARDLTRQLLAFARRQIIEPVSLDLNAVVQGSLKLLERLVGEDVELRTTLAPSLWLTFGDPGQVEQVLMNLVVNARDAMPRGGQLAIETSEVQHTTGEHPGDWVQLAVRDSGVGLSAEAKLHLFEPFFTTKPVGKGTGLGLATVYGIVAQANGFIEAESEAGKGATFRVFFPRVDRVTKPREPTLLDEPHGTETILLVEDDAQVREVTARLLRGGGYTVMTAARPSIALELPVEQLRGAQLLVSDVVMPGLGGRVLADELRARHPALRVLFVSGYTHDAIAEHGVVDTGVEFLAKPFTAAALLARVRTVLDAQ